MGLQDTLKTVVKKVSLELIYEVVDERTKDLAARLERVENRIEHLDERFNQLNVRIDGLYQMILDLARHRPS